MIDRQIESPIPMPLDLVVKKAVNSSNNHAKPLKLWKHSAMRLAASRTNAAHQFTNRPLMNSVCPPRCPLA
jgi:hypothetical protein